MVKHLKPEQYYIDLYDRHTVEKCRRIEKDYQSAMKEAGLKKSVKLTDKIRAVHTAYYLMGYFEMGERYLNKSERIREWTESDRKKDELLEAASPPSDIYCLACGESMEVELKTLDFGIKENEPDRVMFILRCLSKRCGKARVFYDNGEERVSKPDLCEKCGGQVKVKHRKGKDKITSIYTCLSCVHIKKYELDMSPAEKEVPDEHFEKDRARFCFDQRRGQEYLGEKLNLERMSILMKELEWRDKNKEVIEKARQIKKLTLIELENLLASSLEKNGYVKLELMKPVMGREVTVDFTVRDAQSGRDSHQSSGHFKKVAIDLLKDTNWRLVVSSLNSRLGILSGSFRGYEKEEDLIKLTKKQ